MYRSIAQEIRRTEVDFYERKVGLDLVDDEKSKSAEDLKGALEQVITFMKDVLGHKVERVSELAERGTFLDLCTCSRP